MNALSNRALHHRPSCPAIIILLLGAITPLVRAEAPLQIYDTTPQRWRWRTIDPPINSDRTNTIGLDSDGSLIALCPGGIYRFDGYQWSLVPQTRPFGELHGYKRIVEIEGGYAIWDDRHMVTLKPGGEHKYLFETPIGFKATWPVIDNNGKLFFAKESTVYRVTVDALVPYAELPARGEKIDAFAFDAQDRLVVCTPKGVARYDGDTWHRISASKGIAWPTVNRIVPAGRRLFLLPSETTDPGFLIDVDSLIPLSDDIGAFALTDAAGLPDGNLLTTTESGTIAVWREGAWHTARYPAAIEEMLRAVVVIDDHRFLVHTGTNRIWVHDFGSRRWRRADPSAAGLSATVVALARSKKYGGIWFGTSHGLGRVEPDLSITDVFKEIDGTPLDGVTAVLEDRSGDLWIGSGSEFNGTFRWDGERWHAISTGIGLETNAVHKIVQGANDDLWFCLLGGRGRFIEDGGLALKRGDQWRLYTTDDGLPDNRCYDVSISPNGTTFVGTLSGIAVLKNDRWESLDNPFPEQSAVHAFGITAPNDAELFVCRGPNSSDVAVRRDGEWTAIKDALGQPLQGNAFVIGPERFLHVTSSLGLYRIQEDVASRISVDVDFPARNYWPVVWDSNSGFWMGSQGGGIIVYKPESKSPPRVIDATIEQNLSEQSWIVRWTGIDLWKETPTRHLNYRVRLDDGDWTPPMQSTHHEYASLTPGLHHFQIVAIDHNGDTSDIYEVKPFDVEVRLFTPQTAAVLGSAFGTLLLAFLVVLWKRHRERAQARQDQLVRDSLETSEHQLRSLIEGVDLVFAQFDDALRLTYISPQVKSICGYSADELLSGDSVYHNRVHPEDRLELKALVDARERREQKAAHAVYRFQHRDGSWRWLLQSQQPRVDLNGKVCGYHVVLLDDTERHIEQDNIREERDYLARLVELTGSQLTDLYDFCAHLVNTVADALDASTAYLGLIEASRVRVIARWDNGGALTNEDAFTLTNSTAEQVVHARAFCHKKPHDAITPGDEFLQQQLCISDAAGIPIFDEKVDVLGVIIVGFESAAGLRDEQVTFLKLVSQLASAFIQRHRAEHERRKSERMLRAALDNLPAAAFRLDRELMPVFVSDSCRLVTGYSPEDFLTQRVHYPELIHPDDRPGVLDEIGASMNNLSSFTLEYRLLHADGQYRWVWARARVHTDSDGNTTGVEGFVADITEQREVQQRLEESETRLQTVISHAPIILFLIDAEGKITFSSGKGLGRLNIREGEHDGLSVFELYSHVPAIQQNVRRALNGEAFQAFVEFDGHAFDTWHGPVRDADGRVTGMIGVAMDATDRRQAELKRTESERTLQTLMTNLPGMVYRCRNDEHWTMDFVSDGCLHLTGFSPVDLTQSRTVSFADLIHPDDRNAVWENVQIALEVMAPFQLEYRIRQANGHLRWVWEQGRGIFDDNNELVALEGFITDITDRERARALQQSQSKSLEQIAIGTPLPAVLEGLTRSIEQLSEGMLCSVLLLDDAGERLRHGAAPSLPADYSAAIDNTRIGPSVGSCGTAAYRDERIIVTDIATDPLWEDYRDLAMQHDLHSCWSQPIRGADGTVLGTFAVYYRKVRTPTSAEIDLIEQAARLTSIAIERYRANEALNRERDFSRTVIERSPAFFAAINGDGKTVLMNKTMLKALGYEHDEVVGTDYLTTFVPESDWEILKPIFAGFAQDVDATFNENHVLTKSGRALLVEWRGNAVRDETGTLQYFFGVGVDITERRRLEEQVRQQQRMETVGTLAAGIAHEFNNMMGALHGHLTEARRTVDDHASSREPLNQIEKVADRCTYLVRSLLTFSRQLPVKWTRLYLGDVVHEAVDLLKPSFRSNIQLVLECEDDLPPIRGDSWQLQQMLINLCLNARDAMPGGGRLVISTRFVPKGVTAEDETTADAVELAVGDTGLGMTDAVRDRALEPFFSTKEVGKGTGLGLSFVDGIVKNHKGRLHIQSEPNMGTIVRIRFAVSPSIDAPPPPPSIRAPAVGTSHSNGLHVLFADDENGLRESNAKYLRSVGMTVTEAPDGDSAMNAFNAEPGAFDVVVLDYKMPGIDGLTCLKQIRRASQYTAILVTTGFMIDELQHECDAEDNIRLLEKPYRPEELAEALRDIAARAGRV